MENENPLVKQLADSLQHRFEKGDLAEMLSVLVIDLGMDLDDLQALVEKE